MSQWGWTPERDLGIWQHGAGWLKPVMAVAPYLTVGLLLLMLHLIGGTLASSRGVFFDLPSGTFTDLEKTDLVALVMPMARETVVFFDDSRYVVGDPASMLSFSESLAARTGREEKSLLLLADRRVSAGDVMTLLSIARAQKVSRVLVAGRKEEAGE